MPDSTAWQDVCRWEFATERDVEEDLDDDFIAEEDEDEEVNRVLGQEAAASAAIAAVASSAADRQRLNIIQELRERQRLNDHVADHVVEQLERRETVVAAARKSIERIDTDDEDDEDLEEEDEDESEEPDSDATHSLRSEDEVVQRDRDDRVITLRSSTTGKLIKF